MESAIKSDCCGCVDDNNDDEVDIKILMLKMIFLAVTSIRTGS